MIPHYPDPDTDPLYALCNPCLANNHGKCWIQWTDYLDGVAWRCNCWKCIEILWMEAEDGEPT